VSVRPHVERWWREEDRAVCAAAFDAAQAWLNCPCSSHAAASTSAAGVAYAAYVATNAATVAIYVNAANDYVPSAAAYAARAAAYAARCIARGFADAPVGAEASYAAAFAAYAANGAAANAKAVLDTVIDAYYERTGKPRPEPDVERVAAACRLAGMR
jgi:hypothetical protein